MCDAIAGFDDERILTQMTSNRREETLQEVKRLKLNRDFVDFLYTLSGLNFKDRELLLYRLELTASGSTKLLERIFERTNCLIANHQTDYCEVIKQLESEICELNIEDPQIDYILSIFKSGYHDTIRIKDMLVVHRTLLTLTISELEMSLQNGNLIVQQFTQEWENEFLEN